ncbi:hypothetical protein DCC81_23950 [Chitinophaga parva]|uniref:Uncharacterized protein n=1 Tax=Chitinophaga parva TaxID=2169414 RepID=A0A2T7BED6_9BACT|nr:hypothetical protein [Chitinophaga parva]PUZ23435.1 hypothetical protein DCC81_23950 [Chitinophaga parva]
MEKRQLFKSIYSIIHHIEYYEKYKTFNIPAEDGQVIKNIWIALNNTPVDVTCPQCVATALSVISSYFHREYPIYIYELEEAEREAIKAEIEAEYRKATLLDVLAGMQPKTEEKTNQPQPQPKKVFRGSNFNSNGKK